MAYTAVRDLIACPRKKRLPGQKKPNRSRRHRLNPGRRTVEENRAAR